jgi:hypothetical protein
VVLAVLAALPALIVALRGGPPPPVGTDPTPTVETRPIQVPGYEGAEWDSPAFTDAEHGWAWISSSSRERLGQSGGIMLIRTADGGRSWQPVEVPEGLGEYQVNPLPLDGQTLTLQLLDRDEPEPFLLTTDAGATWTRFARAEPPPEALRAETRMTGHEGWGLLCPGSGFFFGGGGDCDQLLLSRTDAAPVEAQPLMGDSTYIPGLRVTDDGRIWLLNNTAGYPRVQVSSDEAHTWQVLPDPPAPDGIFALSQDGTDLWLISSSVYRLVNDAWQPQDITPGIADAAKAIGDGTLVTYVPDAGLTLAQNGNQRSVPGAPAAVFFIEVLTDGTWLGWGGNSVWLGANPGLPRAWVQIPFAAPQ